MKGAWPVGVRKCRIVDMTGVRAQLVAACSSLFNSNLLGGVEEQGVVVLASLGPVSSSSSIRRPYQTRSAMTGESRDAQNPAACGQQHELRLTR
jgi:hypothetical protein